VSPAPIVRLISSTIVRLPLASATTLVRLRASIAICGDCGAWSCKLDDGIGRTVIGDRNGGLASALRALLAALLVALASGATAAQRSLLVLGDSLSAEYGLARNTGWVELMTRRIADSGLQYNVVNASISGETTSGGLARLPQLLERWHPSIVVIELGANDGLRGLPLSALRENLQRIVKACRDAKSQALLIGMRLPPNYGRPYSEGFAAVFDDVARDSGVPLVPFLLDGIADQRDLFQADQLHPVAAAEPRIVDNVWPRLRPLLQPG
jgi:acyl-CoA thioesterase-1